MGLKKLIRNLKYLTRIDLRNNFVSHNDLNNALDHLKYEIVEDLPKLEIPRIKSIMETIDDLITTKSSICRFGDGELQLIAGNDIIFQKSSIKIAERLKEVLASRHQNIFIAIPRVIFSTTDNINPVAKKFWRLNGEKFRKNILKYINLEQQYYSAEVTIAYAMYQNYDLETYFSKLQQLWQDKDIVIICGKTIFNKIDNNIFSCAKSIQYIYSESINAFEQYDDLLEKALKIDKNKVIITILGPAAKILAYDLALSDYQALDLGHIAKSYDWYVKNKHAQDINSAVEFFNPE